MIPHRISGTLDLWTSGFLGTFSSVAPRPSDPLLHLLHPLHPLHPLHSLRAHRIYSSAYTPQPGEREARIPLSERRRCVLAGHPAKPTLLLTRLSERQAHNSGSMHGFNAWIQCLGVSPQPDSLNARKSQSRGERVPTAECLKHAVDVPVALIQMESLETAVCPVSARGL